MQNYIALKARKRQITLLQRKLKQTNVFFNDRLISLSVLYAMAWKSIRWYYQSG